MAGRFSSRSPRWFLPNDRDEARDLEQFGKVWSHSGARPEPWETGTFLEPSGGSWSQAGFVGWADGADSRSQGAKW